MSKFEEAKNKIILKAERKAMTYLSTKYGVSKLAMESQVELTHKNGSIPHTFAFTGKITCFADSGALLNPVVGVNMTVNENDVEVESENIPATITNALNAAAEHSEIVVASLDGFKLVDNGSKYLEVSHSALQDANLGIVGKIEYSTSPNKQELLETIVKDAVLETKVSFSGEFKEPVIEKVAIVKQASKEEIEKEAKHGFCDKCGVSFPHTAYDKNLCDKCENDKQPKKSSWLTDTEPPMSGAEFMEYQCPVCKESFEDYDVNQHDKSCPGTPEVMHDKPTIAIKEDMPMARSADYLVQEKQSEDQSMLEAQIKVEHEAANQLMSLLQGMGYGSAKVIEVTSSAEGLDIMTAIDDGGAVKAVSIPVSVKAKKVLLPKKALISTLIAKGLNVQAKLAEQFDLEVLEKLAAIEERMVYESAEAEAILNEKVASVEKAAAGEKQPFFDSDDSTMTVQKHLLPNNSDLKVGDRLNDGVDDWEIVNTEGQQNDKNEGSSSQWTLKKVQGPERDGKEPKNKIPS